MTNPSAIQEVAFEDQIWTIANYTIVSATILWLYDFFQTLPAEIEAMWSKKLTITAAIFFVDRYGFGGARLLELAYNVPGSGSDKGCNVLNLMSTVFFLPSILATNLLFALRIYAICGRSKLILCVASILIFSRFAVDIWQAGLSTGISTRGSQYESLSLCLSYAPHGDVYEHVIAVLLALAFDVFVFAVTLFKTVHQVIAMRKFGHRSIAEVVLRDGTLYFITIVLLAVAATILNLLSISQGSSQAFNVMSEIMAPFFSVLPNILTNRLVLNLRNVDQNRSTHSSALETRPFEAAPARSRFLGNIGEPLDSLWLDMSSDDNPLDDERGDIRGSSTMPMTPTDRLTDAESPPTRRNVMNLAKTTLRWCLVGVDH
ncbi:uncharacterized protein STEHIDRAFT_154890 [Stereum hirsutum FP-91666 SS1]|uniref:uncharacterized protein n=1 Tax=Stereum hirsutum (strain FP-91666) TaxID=721885 RepID=UPI000440A0C4|nr:uncharacterized protein STEHIDRAFT_154890 [Stereum hirsutum FP-91666 SS1]EIM89211.1 hypothetical protein STEHIDRAFT_154890 [Stereum hirsutum FP-91666 SS1]